MRAPLSKNLHHAEVSQLNFIGCQMTGLHMKWDVTKRSTRTDFKIARTVKNCYKCVKAVKIVVKNITSIRYFPERSFTGKLISNNLLCPNVKERKEIIMLYLKIVQNSDVMKVTLFIEVMHQCYRSDSKEKYFDCS